jgi:hypothetical protein
MVMHGSAVRGFGQAILSVLATVPIVLRYVGTSSLIGAARNMSRPNMIALGLADDIKRLRKDRFCIVASLGYAAGSITGGWLLRQAASGLRRGQITSPGGWTIPHRHSHGLLSVAL